MEDSEQQVADVKVEPLTEDEINIKEEPILNFQDEIGTIKEEPLFDFPSYIDLKVEQKSDPEFLSQDTLVPPEFVALNSIKTEHFVESSSDVVGCEPSELNQSQTESCRSGKTARECFICLEKFSSKECALFHKCNFKTTQKYAHIFNFPCKICNINCIDIEDYSRHMKEIHFACKICNLTFKNRTELTLHENVHKLGLIFFYKCYCCGIEFSRVRQIQIHLKKTTEYSVEAPNSFRYITTKKYLSTINYHKKQLICPYCDLNVRESKFLLTHLEEQHKIFRCKDCGIHFINKCPSKSKATRRLKKILSNTYIPDSKLSTQHNTILSSTENECGININSIDPLPKPIELECNYCGNWFPENEIIIHKIKVHNVFKCLTCDNEGTISNYKKCSLCIANVSPEKSKNSEDVNDRHTVSETKRNVDNEDPEEILNKKQKIDNEDSKDEVPKTREYKCSYCSEIFLDIDKLNKHVHFANSASSYLPCLICGVNFATSSEFENHMKNSHIACMICLANFETVSELDAHSEIHAYQNVYKCPCNKKIYTLKEAIDHKNSHLLKSTEYELLPVPFVMKPVAGNDSCDQEES